MNSVIMRLKKSNPGILARREFWRIRGQHVFNKYDDLTHIKKSYKKTGRELDLENPKRYTEKLQWLKLFWRDDLATICSDKYLVRFYLEQNNYGYLLNDLIAVYESVDDIDIDALPARFVLKAAHGSGWNLIVKDKSKINWFWWKRIMRSWMKQNLYWFGREWNYQDQKPRIIVEKYLEDDSGELRDYKIFCFNGKPTYIRFDENRTKNHAWYYTDIQGRVLDIQTPASSEKADVKLGEAQKKMIEIAAELSKPFPQVRVDFYECEGKIIFGEMTFFHDCGYFSFRPDKWDEIWGAQIQLPAPNYNIALYNTMHTTV